MDFSSSLSSSSGTPPGGPLPESYRPAAAPLVLAEIEFQLNLLTLASPQEIESRRQIQQLLSLASH
jgi:hypothetical protein